MKRDIKLVANNKKAYHYYFVEETYEAGIELTGTKIKSVRSGKVSIKESFVKIKAGQALFYGMNISPYEQGTVLTWNPPGPAGCSSTSRRSASWTRRWPSTA